MYRVGILCGTAAANDLQRIQTSFNEVYNAFHQTFPHEAYAQFLEKFQMDLDSYQTSAAYNQEIPNCYAEDMSEEAIRNIEKTKISAFPGSEQKSIYGMDLVSRTVAQLSKAKGPASAQVAALGAVSNAAVQQMKGILQAVVAVAATDIPPFIAPPVWTNQPLPCLPMVTGHNCEGAVKYPITMGDFIMADASDRTLDANVAGFAGLYRSKVGKSDGNTYQQCYDAYMSMNCASMFPTCTTPLARQDMVPGVGRAPMCFVHCIATLIACPGFWVEDIASACQDVSVPPVCALATFHKPAPGGAAGGAGGEGKLRCPEYDADLDHGAGAGGASGGAAAGAVPAPTL